MNKKNLILLLLLFVITVSVLINVYLVFMGQAVVFIGGKVIKYKEAIKYHRISKDDLKSGINCNILISGSIENGWNSDSLYNLYGSIEKFKTGEATFTLILDNHGNLVQKYDTEPNEYNRDYKFQIISDSDSGISAFIVLKPFKEYLDIDFATGQFRYNTFAFYEGWGNSMGRGLCSPVKDSQ